MYTDGKGWIWVLTSSRVHGIYSQKLAMLLFVDCGAAALPSILIPILRVWMAPLPAVGVRAGGSMDSTTPATHVPLKRQNVKGKKKSQCARENKIK